MQIEVRLFATLRDLFPPEKRGIDILQLEEGSTISDLINYIKIPQDTPLIIMVNGIRKLDDVELKDGDRIGIFPPVGGG
ncbi:MAG: MoaD/ThiS family protein [Peptococcales bacterium]|jgi:molybdopterin synthase sulfur carrier subunit